MSKGLGCLCWPAHIRQTYNDEEQFMNKLSSELNSRPGPNTGAIKRSGHLNKGSFSKPDHKTSFFNRSSSYSGAHDKSKSNERQRLSDININNNNSEANGSHVSPGRRTNSLTFCRSTPESLWEDFEHTSSDAFNRFQLQSTSSHRPPLFKPIKDRNGYPSLLKQIPPTPGGCSQRSRAATLPAGLAASLRIGMEESGDNWKKYQQQQQQQTCSCSCCNDITRNAIYKQPNGFAFIGNQLYYNARQEAQITNYLSRSRSLMGSKYSPVRNNQMYDTPIQFRAVNHNYWRDANTAGVSACGTSAQFTEINDTVTKLNESVSKCSVHETCSALNVSHYSTPPSRYSRPVISNAFGCEFLQRGDGPEIRAKTNVKLNQIVPTRTSLIGQDLTNENEAYSQVRPQSNVVRTEQSVTGAGLQSGDVYKTARSYKLDEAAYENTGHQNRGERSGSGQDLGGTVSDQDLGGRVSDQDLGGRVSDQDLGGRVSNQDVGGGVSDQDRGGGVSGVNIGRNLGREICLHDRGGEVSDQDLGEEVSVQDLEGGISNHDLEGGVSGEYNCPAREVISDESLQKRSAPEHHQTNTKVNEQLSPTSRRLPDNEPTVLYQEPRCMHDVIKTNDVIPAQDVLQANDVIQSRDVIQTDDVIQTKDVIQTDVGFKSLNVDKTEKKPDEVLSLIIHTEWEKNKCDKDEHKNNENELKITENILGDENEPENLTPEVSTTSGINTNVFTEIDLLFMSPPPQCHAMTLHPYMNSTSMNSTDFRSSGRIDNDYLEVPEPKNYFNTVIPPNCHTLPRRADRNVQFDEYLNDSFKPDVTYKDVGHCFVNKRSEKKRSSSDSSATVYTTIAGEVKENCLIDNYKNRKQQQKEMWKQQQQQQQQQQRHLTPSHLNQLYVHFAKMRALSSSSSSSALGSSSSTLGSSQLAAGSTPSTPSSPTFMAGSSSLTACRLPSLTENLSK